MQFSWQWERGLALAFWWTGGCCAEAPLLAVGKGTCAIAHVPRAELSQQHGFVHAAVVAAIADAPQATPRSR